MSLLLGCIADDFTGATDLAGFLVKQGFLTIQINGIPQESPDFNNVDAVVVALKSRTAPLEEAIGQSLEALHLLKNAGAEQFYFKYCSTFDSTEQGNIGPVIDALMEELGIEFTIACPALPINGRSVYQGHLFVNGVLLNESGMENHPLTPMTDPNLVRFLGKQVRGNVGLVPFEIVEQGFEAIQDAFDRLESEGKRYAIVDAVNESNLHHLGKAVKNLKLITGGSGLSINLAANFSLATQPQEADQLPQLPGNVAILSGSCSTMTQQQVLKAKEKFPALYLDPKQLIEDPEMVLKAVQWGLEKSSHPAFLIYSTSPSEKVKEIQDLLGVEKAGSLIENSLTQIAQSLNTAGIRKFVIAGGETSGAIVKALEVQSMQIGPEISPGVPWTLGLKSPPIALALKSGNFGSPDFFEEALEKIS